MQIAINIRYAGVIKGDENLTEITKMSRNYHAEKKGGFLDVIVQFYA